MKQKHTPGKWEAQGVEVFAGSSKICDCEPYETQKSTETCFANARLCATAPELLAALKELTRAINLKKLNVNNDFTLIARHAFATKIIAKAEGRI